jgi:hypothetical protein
MSVMLSTWLVTHSAAPAFGSAPPPTFPSSFYVGEQMQTLINQGGVRHGKSTACCGAKSAQCKVESQFAGSDYREDAKMNRSRVDSPAGSIVSWYQIASPQFPHDGMQMLVQPTPSGSKHKYSCVSYCPLAGATFVSALGLGDKTSGPMGVPKDLGKTTVTQAPPGAATKTCERWMWKQGLAAPKHNWSLVMSQEDFFVADGSGVPFLHKTTIEPNGQYMGESNVSFLGFQPGDTSDYFDIDPQSMKACKGSTDCDQSGGGEDDLARSRLVRAVYPRPTSAPSYLQLARASLKQASTPSSATSSSGSSLQRRLSEYADVDLPLNYVSEESSTMLIAQGALPHGASDDVCCDLTSPGCQVQLQHFEGTRYFDWQNQRQRIEDHIARQTVVDDYDNGKSMLVQNRSGVETCIEFCPITLEDDMQPLRLPKEAVDLGPTTLDGKTVEHWRWSDKVLKVIKMQTYDFYAENRSVPAAAATLAGRGEAVAKVAYCEDEAKRCYVPIFSSEALTPFGQRPPIGYQNTSWLSLQMQLPAPAKFKIAGEEACPQSPSCGSSTWQAHRLRSHQLHGFYSYLRAV